VKYHALKQLRLIHTSVFLLALCSVGILFFSKKGSSQSFPILSPEAAWSGSYLVNSVFLSEYALLWKDGIPVDEALMVQPTAMNLWKRAFFAVEAMRLRGQGQDNQQALKTYTEQHYDMLVKVQPSLSEERELIRLAAAMPEQANDQSRANAGYQLIVASFTDEKHRANVTELRNFYFADAPTCPITASEVKEFAVFQGKLLSEKSAINGSALIAPLKHWPQKKVRCLIFALLATSGPEAIKAGNDPIHLMLTFQQMGSPLAKDAAYKAVYSIRLLRTNQFAETLRILVDMVDLQPAFRLPYEMVQRIFSMRQKGDGQVALKGL